MIPVFYPADEPVSEELKHKGGLSEGIKASKVLRILDTPLGRILVVICKDFLSNRIQINLLRPDIVLVPAMSKGISSFSPLANSLARRYYSIITVANSVHPLRVAREFCDASDDGKPKSTSLFASPEIDGFIQYVDERVETSTRQFDLRFSPE